MTHHDLGRPEFGYTPDPINKWHAFACSTCNLLVIDTDPSSDVFEVTVARHQDGACFGAEVAR